MKVGEDVPRTRRFLTSLTAAAAELARARQHWTPTAAWLSCILVRLPRWRALVAYLPAIVGLLCQMVLVWMAGELLDLYVSAVELWSELARKHLELTLS